MDVLAEFLDQRDHLRAHAWLYGILDRSFEGTLKELSQNPEGAASAEQRWHDDHASALTAAVGSDTLELVAALRWLDEMNAIDVAATYVPFELEAARASEAGDGTWWILPPRPWRIADLVPKSRQLHRDAASLARDLHAELDLRCSVIRVPPGRATLEVAAMPALPDLHLRGRRDSLIIGLSSPLSRLRFELAQNDGAPHPHGEQPYHFVGLHADDLDGAGQAVDQVLEACVRECVDVLVLPELEVPPPVLALLQAALSRRGAPFPALVVAGSFHVEGRNRCTVLDARGEPLWTQDKIDAFRIPEEQCTPALVEMGLSRHGNIEAIDLGHTLQVRDSAIGRLATPICLDFCGNTLDAMTTDARIDLYLVPAMTPETGRFVQRARDNGTRSRAASFVSNSGWVLRHTGSKALVAMAYLPAKDCLVEQQPSLDVPLYVIKIHELMVPLN